MCATLAKLDIASVSLGIGSFGANLSSNSVRSTFCQNDAEKAGDKMDQFAEI